MWGHDPVPTVRCVGDPRASHAGANTDDTWWDAGHTLCEDPTVWADWVDSPFEENDDGSRNRVQSLAPALRGWQLAKPVVEISPALTQ